jgi:DNA-binding response OmpR family regulator
MTARILVIDDELPLLESITDILDLAGYATLAAHGGMAGVSLIKAEKPTLVLCDLMMPGTDGYAVLREVQADLSTAHIPMVMVSAKSDPDTIQRALNSGAVDFVSKPFALNELLEVIERHLQDEPV